MGFSFTKRHRVGKNTHVNASKSGVSLSRKAGPVTINSRGRVTVNFGHGMKWRSKL